MNKFMRYLMEHKRLTILIGIICVIVGFILQEFLLHLEFYFVNDTLTIIFMGIGFCLLIIPILSENVDRIKVVVIKSLSIFFLIILVSSILTKMNVSNDSWVRTICIVSTSLLLLVKVKK